MTSFRFNFSCEDVEVQGENTTEQELNGVVSGTKEIQENNEWLDSEEVLPDVDVNYLDEVASHALMFTCGEVEIGHLCISEAMHNLEKRAFENPVGTAIKEHSDLIPGKYEGGMKIWECTYDLIDYLVKNKAKITFKEGQILDLGCGAGILGIYAFLNNSYVTFQDYNMEVLKLLTIPNVMLNIEDTEDKEHKEIQRCKFFSGDWDKFNKMLPSFVKYDLILTSETIYNVDSYDKLIKLFVDRLNETGAAYVAAKVHYFGVGGGIRHFEKCVDKSEKLISEVCWKSTDGIQREIIKITHKNNI